MLSTYRIGLLVLANIHSDREAVKNLIAEFDALANSYENKSERVNKEMKFFTEVYNKVRKNREDFNLPERN